MNKKELKHVIRFKVTASYRIVFAVFMLAAGTFIFSANTFAVWNGTFYAPGSTLNPECQPGQVNCDVTPVATSGENSNITALHGLTDPINVSQGGTGLTGSLPTGTILFGTGGQSMGQLAAGSVGQMLSVDSSGNPAWITPAAPTAYSAASGLLVNSGVFTLDVGHANTWTAVQTFNGGLTLGGDTYTNLAGTGLAFNGGSLSATLGTAIDSSEISDGAITGADIADATISLEKLSQGGCAYTNIMQWNGTTWTCGTYVSSAGQITNVPDGSLTSTDVQSAINELDTKKLANDLSSGMLFIGNSSDKAAAVTVSGDISLANDGAMTISNNAVTLGADTTGNYIRDLSGSNGITITGSGSESASVTVGLDTAANINWTGAFNFQNGLKLAGGSTVTSLTGLGLSLSGGTLKLDPSTLTAISSLASTDSVLTYQGGQAKLITKNDLFSDIIGGMNYQGTWNAATNIPSLTSSCAAMTKGQYYVVSVAGTTSLDGIAAWNTNDWAVCNGAQWQRVQTTNNLTSVFGRTGTVTAQNGDYTASQVTNTPAGTITGTTVQGALNELDTKKVASGSDASLKTVTVTSGQAQTVALLNLSNNVGNVSIFNTNGTPEMNVSAGVGSVAINSANGTMYIKTSGTDTTGWTQFGTSNGCTAIGCTFTSTGTNAIDVSGTNGGLTVNANGTGSLAVGSAGSGAVSLGTNSGALNLGTGTNAKTVTVGNTTGASGVVVNAGTAGLTVNANSILNGTVSATGDLKINTNKFGVNASDGSVSAAGDLKINTDKFTVGASTGNTSVAGTLNSAGNLSVGTKFTVNATDGGVASNLDSLTSGSGLSVSSTSTGLTGSLVAVSLTGNNSANNGTLMSLSSTGASSAATGLKIDTSAGTGLAADIKGALALRAGTTYTSVGTQNDVNFGNASTIRLNPASALTITGIKAGTDGQLLTLMNASSIDVTLSNQNTTSTAANRIISGTGSDLTLKTDASVLLQYDGTSQRWRAVGGTGGSAAANAPSAATIDIDRNFLTFTGSPTAAQVAQVAYVADQNTADRIAASYLQALTAYFAYTENDSHTDQELSPVNMAAIISTVPNSAAWSFATTDVDNATGSGVSIINSEYYRVIIGSDGTNIYYFNWTYGNNSSSQSMFVSYTTVRDDTSAPAAVASTQQVAPKTIRTTAMPSVNGSAPGLLRVSTVGVVRPYLANVAGTTVAMSNITAALANGSLDNGAYTQTWNWNSLGANNGLVLNSGDTAATGNLFNVTSASTGSVTNGLARFNFSAAHTGNGVQIDDATAAGAALAIGVNALTSGNGLKVTSSSAGMTGSLVNVTLSGNNAANTGSLISLSSTGATSAATGLRVDTSAGAGLAIDASGALALRAGTTYTSVGTQNDVNFGNASTIRLNPASSLTITGIKAGKDGQVLSLMNVSTQSIILANKNTGSLAANRIATGTGVDITMTADATILLQYDATSTLWRVVGGTGGGSNANTVQNMSASSSVSAWGSTVMVDATSSTLTSTLPTAVGNGGKLIEVVKSDSSSNAVGIKANGSQTINGSTNQVFLYNQNDSVVLRSDGANVVIVADNRTGGASGTGGVQYMMASRTTAQLSGLTTNGPIQFTQVDASSGTDITYNTSTSIFTLKAGRTYRLTADPGSWWDGGNHANFQWYNLTSSAYIGVANANRTINRTDNYAGGGAGEAIITPSVDTQVQFRIQNAGTLVAIGAADSSGTNTNGQAFPSAYIEQLSGPAAVTNTVDYAFARISAASSISVSSGSAVPFFTNGGVTAGNMPLSASSRFTLMAGKTYALEATVAQGNNTEAKYGIWDVTNNVLLGEAGYTAGNNYASGAISSQSHAKAIVTPSTNIQVELRAITGTLVVYANGTTDTGWGNVGTWMSVEQLGATANTGLAMNMLSAALSNGSLDNGSYSQTWNWNSLGANNGLTLNSTDTSATANLLRVTSSSTGNLTNGGINFGFANHTGNGFQIDDATTAGTVMAVNANSLTSGNGLNITSNSAAMTGSLAAITLSGNNASNTGNLLSLSVSGASSAATGLKINMLGTGLAQDITGGIAWRSKNYTSIGTQNNVDFGNTTTVRLNPTAALSISGIANGSDGKLLTVLNSSSFTVTLLNANAGSNASNRILTGTGADMVIQSGSAAILQYDSGATSWRVISRPAYTQSFMMATLTAAQTAGLAAGNPVRFNSVSTSGGSNISLNTSTYTFTLLANRTYDLSATINYALFNDTGVIYADYRWYNTTSGAAIGQTCAIRSTMNTGNDSSSPACQTLFTPTVNTTVQLLLGPGQIGTLTQLGTVNGSDKFFPTAIIKEISGN